MRSTARSVVAIAAAVALAAPLSGPQAASLFHRAQASEAYEDGLMASGNGVALLPGHSGGPDIADWLQFQTNSCGRLQGMGNRRSMLTQSALGDDDGQVDDEEEPSDPLRAMIGQWLSAHSEIAVLNDAVQKSCDDYSVLDEEFTSDLMAAWRPRRHATAWGLDSSQIA